MDQEDKTNKINKKESSEERLRFQENTPTGRKLSSNEQAPTDKCSDCGVLVASQWHPEVRLLGCLPAGWKSPLTDGLCSDCFQKRLDAMHRDSIARQEEKMRQQWIAALGGIKAFETFLLDNRIPRIDVPEWFPKENALYIYGTTGSGKSHLATAIARAVAKNPTDVIITKPMGIFRRIRSCDGARYEIEAIERYIHAPVLVIDDLGISSDTAFSAQTIYEIIEGRDMHRNLGLIVTSNLSMDELASKMGDDRIASRLSGMCKTFRVTGPDRRRR